MRRAPGSDALALVIVAVFGAPVVAGDGLDRWSANGGPPNPPAWAPVKLEFTAEEQALWADVHNGKFTKRTFAEAALLASGVTEAAKRRAYLTRLTELEQQARKALAGAKTPAQKGEQLLAWLYGPTGPIGPDGTQKYRKGQTSLAVLLDTGTYNCVSATAAYNVIGRRLGLDLRAVEIPDHVFSVLYDGKARVDVETTTPWGFDPLRDEIALKEWSRRTGLSHVPAPSRKQQREVGEAGLAATICYNRGVTLSRAQRHREAFQVYVGAVNLDRGFGPAADNARCALASWADQAFAAGQVDRGVDILQQNVRWLRDPAGQSKLILAVYDAQGQQLVKKKDWPRLADLYVTAYQRHQEQPDLAKHLEHNAVASYDIWTKPLLASKDWAKAAKVYQGALKRLPGHKHLVENLKYCEAQQHLASTSARRNEVQKTRP